MKIKLFTIIFFSFSLVGFEFNSTHDETYWYPDDENTLDGYHIGTVEAILWGMLCVFLLMNKLVISHRF